MSRWRSIRAPASPSSRRFLMLQQAPLLLLLLLALLALLFRHAACYRGPDVQLLTNTLGDMLSRLEPHATHLDQLLGDLGPQQQRIKRYVSRHLSGAYNIVVGNGYPCENHTVHTPDGYILTLFRIPNLGGPAIFLEHGYLTSSADFVLLGAGRSLAFLLHDVGFDVWMGNNRGTTYSRRHERLRPEQPAFWDYSLQEIGAIDLPSSIDYVLAATKQSQLHYVGHSQGTTVFFIMGSERPEYMAKIKTNVALAPIAFLRDIRSPVFRFLTLSPNLWKVLLRLFRVNEILPHVDLITWLGDTFCADGKITQPLCKAAIFTITGDDYDQINGKILTDLMANAPAGVSGKQTVQFTQQVHVPDLALRKYDYGPNGNLQMYGQRQAPAYNLSRVSATTYLFTAPNDLLAVESNLRELARVLPNIPRDGFRPIPFAKFNHMDLVYGKNAKELVYDDLVDLLLRREAQFSAG